MGPVPLGRADIGHRLDGLVFGRKRRGEGISKPSGGPEAISEDVIIHCRQHFRHRYSLRSPGELPLVVVRWHPV